MGLIRQDKEFLVDAIHKIVRPRFAIIGNVIPDIDKIAFSAWALDDDGHSCLAVRSGIGRAPGMAFALDFLRVPWQGFAALQSLADILP